MRYSDGTRPELGDRVRLHVGELATIIGDVGRNTAADECSRVTLMDMKSGYLVVTDNGALISFEEASLDDFDLVHRV